jgi:regulator of sirC expression with transglutaminase-like and TPR domain
MSGLAQEVAQRRGEVEVDLRLLLHLVEALVHQLDGSSMVTTFHVRAAHPRAE